MTLVKTGLLNAIAVAVRLLAALGLNKILAVYVGPAGYALIGQFQNAVSIITAVPVGAVNTGVTKYTAEYFDDETRQRVIWSTAGSIAIIGSGLTSLVIAIFHRLLGSLFLKDEALGSVFLWLAATLVFFVLNTLLLAILNGKKKIFLYIVVSITGSVTGLAITGALVIVRGLYGALVAFTISQALVFLITLVICNRTHWFRLSYLWGRIDSDSLSSLGKFALMAITTATVVPVSQILVRNHLGASFGWQAAGYWQAVSKISDLYLMLITSTLTVYYLPRLSEIREPHDLKREIYRGYRLVLPLAMLGALGIFFMRGWITLTVFTSEFLPVKDLFIWQLFGDVMKIGSWLLAYLMLGKALTKMYVTTEIVFSVSFVGLAIVLTNMLGLYGVTLAFAVNYAIYWLVMGVLINRHVLCVSTSGT